MRIAVIGAGAMGSVYGGLLSVHDDVTLIDTNKALVDHINSEGLCIAYKGEDRIYHPRAAVSSEGIDPVDLSGSHVCKDVCCTVNGIYGLVRP